jgi:hypothetical protein
MKLGRSFEKMCNVSYLNLHGSGLFWLSKDWIRISTFIEVILTKMNK